MNHRKQAARLVKLIIIAIGAILIFLILGTFHIVTDTDEIFVERPYFGFSDIIGSTEKCIGLPYFIAMSQHPSLCKVLMDDGYIGRDE